MQMFTPSKECPLLWEIEEGITLRETTLSLGRTEGPPGASVLVWLQMQPFLHIWAYISGWSSLPAITN